VEEAAVDGLDFRIDGKKGIEKEIKLVNTCEIMYNKQKNELLKGAIIGEKGKR
jgi:hypothetical protein